MTPSVAFLIGLLVGSLATTIGILLILALCASASSADDTCRDYLNAREDYQESEDEE